MKDISQKMIPLVPEYRMLKRFYHWKKKENTLPEEAHWKLEKIDNERYKISQGEKRVSPMIGILYIFVTMADGSIRIGLRESQEHAWLADCAEVRYAGEVTFKKIPGEEGVVIAQWSNGAYTYRPPARLAHQAGLDLNLFVASIPEAEENPVFKAVPEMFVSYSSVATEGVSQSCTG